MMCEIFYTDNATSKYKYNTGGKENISSNKSSRFLESKCFYTIPPI